MLSVLWLQARAPDRRGRSPQGTARDLPALRNLFGEPYRETSRPQCQHGRPQDARAEKDKMRARPIVTRAENTGPNVRAHTSISYARSRRCRHPERYKCDTCAPQPADEEPYGPRSALTTSDLDGTADPA